jgi:hypothetical protein
MATIGDGAAERWRTASLSRLMLRRQPATWKRPGKPGRFFLGREMS